MTMELALAEFHCGLNEGGPVSRATWSPPPVHTKNAPQKAGHDDGGDCKRAMRCRDCYRDTVCTTLETGRVLAVGSFASLAKASSYSGSVCSFVFAVICTTL